ncbi:hypothetical protein OVY01_13025 [Robbsia sp. Bb-Pol-6]|uniref:Uncharacterized protein n=1 Tax=Robbsia betulipollinis TaxID=2981849 RepID=A0ABT3ZQH8_9BURK|nr:hypothetical protein [Robbsia betulipollinis]MCY0388143.1 hypothetical protein [Robbsia betulipollinis]
MLSACSSINRGLEAVLDAERTAHRDTATLITRHEARSRDRRAALAAMGERLERQSEAVLRQQGEVERIAGALAGPHGLQDRLVGLQEALQAVTAGLASRDARQCRRMGAIAPVIAAPVPRQPRGKAG